MYEGKNPTALNSQDWLIDALLALMETTEYARITVRAICAKADLSRQTFYNFFDSKDDIIRCCIQRCYAELQSALSGKSPLQLGDVAAQLTATFLEHDQLFRLILSHHLEPLLEHELATAITEFAGQVAPAADRKFVPYGTAFLAGAIAHTMVHWFKDESPLTQDELAGLLAEILSGNYYRIQA